MRIVIVNACHPNTSHVCALRARAFAAALADRGHRLLLLTPPLGEAGRGDDPHALADRLAAHDWRKPCTVAGGMHPRSVLPALRHGRIPSGIRQALIAWNYAVHGNMYEDWCADTRPLLPVIAASFQPDAVWAVFGHTGCWQVGQELARHSKCRWVADLKDSWTNFIPAVFRGHLARRYGDAAHLTVLSATHAETVAGFLADIPRTIIYSGIAQDVLSDDRRGDGPATAERLILMTGGTYGMTSQLNVMIEALGDCLTRHPDPQARETVFAYAGADGETVADAARVLDGSCTVRMLGFLPLEQLQALQKKATLNLYLRCPPFHHKVFELFVADRPIVCHPGESAETIQLAAEVGARFHSCATMPELEDAFSRILSRPERPENTVDRTALARYSWEEQARTLEAVLAKATGS